MVSKPTSSYARELKPALPGAVFEPARSRLLWLPVQLAVIALGIISLAAGWVPWVLAGGVSLVLGASFAGLTFLAHETLHGAVVRGQVPHLGEDAAGTVGTFGPRDVDVCRHVRQPQPRTPVPRPRCQQLPQSAFGHSQRPVETIGHFGRGKQRFRVRGIYLAGSFQLGTRLLCEPIAIRGASCLRERDAGLDHRRMRAWIANAADAGLLEARQRGP